MIIILIKIVKTTVIIVIMITVIITIRNTQKITQIKVTIPYLLR